MLAVIDWTPIILGALSLVGSIVTAWIAASNRRALKTHNGLTIGEQVEQANVSSAASLVHTTQLVAEVAPPAPPLADAARAGLEEAAAVVPIVIVPPKPGEGA